MKMLEWKYTDDGNTTAVFKKRCGGFFPNAFSAIDSFDNTVPYTKHFGLGYPSGLSHICEIYIFFFILAGMDMMKG